MKYFPALIWTTSKILNICLTGFVSYPSTSSKYYLQFRIYLFILLQFSGHVWSLYSLVKGNEVSIREEDCRFVLFWLFVLGCMETPRRRNTACPGLAGTSEGHLVQHSAHAGSATTSCSGLCPGRFAYFQGWRLHKLTGQPVPVLGQSHCKKVFPDVQRHVIFQSMTLSSQQISFLLHLTELLLLILLFGPVASCSVTGHC